MLYLSGLENAWTLEMQHSYPLGIIDSPINSWPPDRACRYRVYAADNGCFSRGEKFSLDDYLAWLDRHTRENCLFATAPDVVGDAVATLERSRPVLATIRAMGFRAAFVSQDGIEQTTVPWDEFDCLFVGGSTEFKLSEVSYAVGHEAKRRGKWLHMGRVNSAPRFRAAHISDFDSVDGTFLKFGPTTNTRRLVSWFRSMEQQPRLDGLFANHGGL